MNFGGSNNFEPQVRSPLGGSGMMGGGGGGGLGSRQQSARNTPLFGQQQQQQRGGGAVDIDANIAAMAAAAGLGGGGGAERQRGNSFRQQRSPLDVAADLANIDAMAAAAGVNVPTTVQVSNQQLMDAGGGGSRAGTPTIYAGQHDGPSAANGAAAGYRSTPPPQQQQQQNLSLQQQLMQMRNSANGTPHDAAGGGGGAPLPRGAGMSRTNSALNGSGAFNGSSTQFHGNNNSDEPPQYNNGGSGQQGGSVSPPPHHGTGGSVRAASATQNLDGTGRDANSASNNNFGGVGGGGGGRLGSGGGRDDDDDIAFASQYHSKAELHDTAMAAMNQSIDAALRAEVKRMREEVTRLRREAQRASQLSDEVKFLRNVTLLQHEEKVPIRLRELERDNLSLRRQVASLEEKLKTYENDEYRQRLALQRSVLTSGGVVGLGDIGGGGGASSGAGGGAGDADGGAADGSQGLGGRRATSLNRKGRSTSMSPNSGRRGANGVGGNHLTSPNGGGGGAGGNGKVDAIIVKTNDAMDSCASCRLKIAAMERVTRADKKELQEALSVTQTRLDAASAELAAIQNWVKSVVANAHQFPNTAGQQPSLDRLASFASPVGVATRDRQLDPRSSLGTQYYQQYADPNVRAQSGLTWSSGIAPQPSYLEARRR